jgi:hypothetical protein
VTPCVCQRDRQALQSSRVRNLPTTSSSRRPSRSRSRRSRRSLPSRRRSRRRSLQRGTRGSLQRRSLQRGRRERRRSLCSLRNRVRSRTLSA